MHPTVGTHCSPFHVPKSFAVILCLLIGWTTGLCSVKAFSRAPRETNYGMPVARSRRSEMLRPPKPDWPDVRKARRGRLSSGRYHRLFVVGKFGANQVHHKLANPSPAVFRSSGPRRIGLDKVMVEAFERCISPGVSHEPFSVPVCNYTLKLEAVTARRTITGFHAFSHPVQT